MLKQKVNFEWNVGDEDFGALLLVNNAPRIETTLTLSPDKTNGRVSHFSAAGQHSASLAPAETGQLLSAGEAEFLWHRLRDLFLIALAVILLGSMPFTPAQVEQRRAEEGVTAALQTEYIAWQKKDRDGFTALLDLPTADRWQWEWRDYWSLSATDFADLGITVRRVDRQDELVRVEALVSRPSVKWWRSSPYREVRFYRETDAGWLRTLPPATYWGSLRTTETEHLRFEYYEHDAPAVEPKIERIETIYRELYALLGRDPVTKYKWTFTLIPDRTDGRTGDYYRYEYVSPALSEVPDMISDQEYVAQMIVSTMTSQAVYGSSPTRRSFLHRWEMVVWSLYGWLRTDLLDQRSPWHAQAQTVFQESLPGQMPLTLDDIENWPDNSRPPQERVMRQYMVSESIIDFAMTTYGRARLPALLEGMEQYRDWDSLTTNVFGVSAIDFERAWNDYLAATYLDQPE